MTLFKNKKQQKPALIYVLEQLLTGAREKKEGSFYYPLWDHEVTMAASWATRHHIMMEKDHKTDNNIFYKFWGIK